jgi:hypothetical protein
MKISWGVKIAILYSSFAIGIIIMVVISMNNDTDLVSENYYEQEIKYQDQIDKLESSVELDRRITIDQTGEFIILKISEFSPENKYSGDVNFYRSSDAKKDFKIPFSPDNNGIQKIESAFLEKGKWKLNLILQNKGKDYFVSKDIFKN